MLGVGRCCGPLHARQLFGWLPLPGLPLLLLLRPCAANASLAIPAVSPACLQSVDVRRGRLVAHGESFVHMLGTAMEGLLNQVW